jgi:single-strand DNA-binding protein
VFSLATRTSWKNDAGTWESQAEWHRCVAFGKLVDFAGTLGKGAHVAVEGELRSHEYQREVAVGTQRTTVPQRAWQIRVDSVLKLDRDAKRDSIDDNHEEVPRRGASHGSRFSKVYTHRGQVEKPALPQTPSFDCWAALPAAEIPPKKFTENRRAGDPGASWLCVSNQRRPNSPEYKLRPIASRMAPRLLTPTRSFCGANSYVRSA